MGSSASKQSGRILSKTASENLTKPIHRTNANPLLHQHQQHPQQHPQQQVPQTQSPLRNELHHPNTSYPLNGAISEGTAPTHVEDKQPETAFGANTSTSFDPAYLHKKLNSQQVQLPQLQQIPQETVPEGKDGGDPHELGTSTYEPSFIDSINKLGKQIKTHEHKLSKSDLNALAVRQLRSRKAQYDMGEKEVKAQMGQSANHLHNLQHELQKTMVHPQTLTAILRDLKDPKVDSGTIIGDYQLKPTFLAELGSIYSVPTNVVPVEDETKPDEVGHKVQVPKERKMTDDIEDGAPDGPERVNKETFDKLKKRLSIDD